MEKRSRSSEAFKLIEDMLELMDQRGLVELEIEQEGMRVKLKKAPPVGAASVVEYVTGTQHPVPPPAPAPSAKHAAADDSSRRVIIKSPMVGTFYRAPSPDAPPFVEAGQDIDVGQVVCIIEAMKLMNEIKSEVSGRVVEVLIENGDAVEFGQPLFALEPR